MTAEVRNEPVIEEVACVGCGACVEVCPPDILRMTSASKACVAYPDECQACFICVDACAFRAIDIKVHLNSEARQLVLTSQQARTNAAP